MSNPLRISRPPTRWEGALNLAFRVLTYVFAWLTVLLVLYIFFVLSAQAVPAIRTYGLGFLTGDEWNFNTNRFGIRPQILGTLYSSSLALLLGSVFGLAVAIFLSERMLSSGLFQLLKLFGLQFHPFWGRLPDSLELLLKNLVELLAAIPSVVYGLWGLFFVIPTIKPACDWLHANLGFIPLFGGQELASTGTLPAVIVLAIMILPTISAVGRDALVAVPMKLREAAYGMGATRWETIFHVTIPTAFTGLAGAVTLAFGRALGETMALAMLMGNRNVFSVSLFAPGNTLASLLANTFPEAGRDDRPVLMYASLVLLAITMLVNMCGSVLVSRARAKQKEHR